MYGQRSLEVGTLGPGLSAYQRGLLRPSQVAAAAGNLELPAQAQQAANMADMARQGAVPLNTAEYQGARNAQFVQAEIAQAPKDPQQLVMEHKLKAMQCCGIEPRSLRTAGETILAAQASRAA